MALENSTIFITGSNRGIGKSFVEEFLKAGAKKIYAAARKKSDLNPIVALDPARVKPVVLDVTNADQIRAAAEAAGDVTMLINNAGALHDARALDPSMDVFRQDMEVNYFGLLAVTRAFVPIIERNGGGTVVNLVSVVSLVNIPSASGYSASKAAAWSITQALRADLAAKKIRVISVFPGPIDTDMAKGVPMDKTPPGDVAKELLAAIADGREDVFPDPMSKQVYATWTKDHKAVEKQFATF